MTSTGLTETTHQRLSRSSEASPPPSAVLQLKAYVLDHQHRHTENGKTRVNSMRQQHPDCIASTNIRIHTSHARIPDHATETSTDLPAHFTASASLSNLIRTVDPVRSTNHNSPKLSINSAFRTDAPAAPRTVLCPITIYRIPSLIRPTETLMPPPRSRSSLGCGLSASS